MQLKQFFATFILLAATLTGNASAGTVTDDLTINLTVPASCTLEATDIDMYHQRWWAAGGNAVSSVSVVCNNELPYVLEVDAGPGGEVVLADAATAKTITSRLLIVQNPTIPTQRVWGTMANGEAVNGVGEGIATIYHVEAHYGAVGWGYGEMPAAGVYTATRNVLLHF